MKIREVGIRVLVQVGTCLVVAITVTFGSMQPVSAKSVSDKPELQIPGNYLLAWRLVDRAFQADATLPSEKKYLAIYIVHFYETPRDIFVEFEPISGPKDNPHHIGCQSQYGRDMEYAVDKKLMKIVRYKGCF